MAGGSGARRTGAVTALDLLLALVLTALCLVEIWVEPIFQTGIPGPRAALSVVVVAGGAALAARGRRPLGAMAGYAAAMLLVAGIGEPQQAAFEFALGAMLVVYSAAAREPLRR